MATKTTIKPNEQMTLVNLSEAVAMTGCSHNTIAALIKAKRFPAPVHARPWLFNSDDVVKWVKVTTGVVSFVRNRPGRPRYFA